MKKQTTVLVILLVGGLGRLLAQDFHLTQHDMAPQYFNPAQTGVYWGEQADYKIYADYRSQWKALGIKPYATSFLAYDQPLKGKDFGVGGFLIHSRNGRGGLNTFNLMPSASYKITRNSEGPHLLAVGIQMGIFYRKFDPDHFTYDSQYTDDNGFDPSLSSGENFSKTSLLKFDANLGVFYKLNKSEWEAKPWGGFSVFHMPRPNQSMTGFEKDKLPMRWAFRAGADWQLNEEILLIPSLLYMNQAKAYELNIGSLIHYKLKDPKYVIVGGLNYRLKDAFILQAGMKYERHIIKISYDINTSYLNNYSSGRGGFEIAMVLTGIKGVKIFRPRF